MLSCTLCRLSHPSACLDLIEFNKEVNIVIVVTLDVVIVVKLDVVIVVKDIGLQF